MNKLGVIAFCGSKGSGKSTSATLLKEVINAPTEEIAIAGHLKEVAAKIFKIDYNYFIDPARKEVELESFIVLDRKNLTEFLESFFVKDFTYDKHIRPHVGRVLRTPRALLQYLGTEVLHPIDPLIHVKAAIQKKDPTKLTVITDLRFMAEFEYFNSSSLAFLPVYVRNPYAEIAASVDAHPSERQFESFKSKCRLLDNLGTLTDLKSGINRLIEEEYE
jgi:hypothetical protein